VPRPAALINATLPDSTPLIANCAVSGFPNRDEELVGEPAILPFSLDDELQRVSGGKFEKSDEPMGEKVVVAREGRLVTRQNPASVLGVAKAVMESIERNRGIRA
jgi:putative intracellular protease/amidase